MRGGLGKKNIYKVKLTNLCVNKLTFILRRTDVRIEGLKREILKIVVFGTVLVYRGGGYRRNVQKSGFCTAEVAVHEIR